jgi:hypothetical protein
MDHREALENAKQALTLDDRLAHCWFMRGFCELQNLDEARRCLLAAVCLDPSVRRQGRASLDCFLLTTDLRSCLTRSRCMHVMRCGQRGDYAYELAVRMSVKLEALEQALVFVDRAEEVRSSPRGRCDPVVLLAPG